jgi:hypothetical protein
LNDATNVGLMVEVKDWAIGLGNRLHDCANFEQARRLFPIPEAIHASKISMRKPYTIRDSKLMGDKGGTLWAFAFSL